MVERAVAERTIVRTWPMGDSLHFVAAAEAPDAGTGDAVGSIDSQGVERGMVKVPTAGREVAEVLSALAVECHHLAVQDGFLNRQFLTDS